MCKVTREITQNILCANGILFPVTSTQTKHLGRCTNQSINMPPTKGKQGTRGKRLIAEENKQTLKIYIYIIAVVNCIYYAVSLLFFWDQFTSLPVFMCVAVSAIYFGSYKFMASMGRVTFVDGEMADPGVDLNMQSGMAEHTKDLILLAALAQTSSLVSNYFWLLLLMAPARAFYILWVNFLGPWFNSSSPQEEVNEKKQKKMERKMKRQQMMR